MARSKSNTNDDVLVILAIAGIGGAFYLWQKKMQKAALVSGIPESLLESGTEF
jgi:hypothetical protein